MAQLSLIGSLAKQPAPFTINLLGSVQAGSSHNSHDCSGAGKQSTAGEPNNPASLGGGAEPFSPLLAASYRTDKDNLDVPRVDSDYLWQELGVDRLNQIHTWLWTVGRPMPARALHHQKLLRREIIVTEQMDMHLVWTTNRIFIKPIPRFLLEPRFWVDHMSCAPGCNCSAISSKNMGQQRAVGCEQAQLRKCALGFLLSYAALVSHESDLFIAQESHLLPEELPWLSWKTFVQQVLNQESIYHHINKRFIYGELRLGRLNAVYRFTGLSLLRGYQTGYSQYSSFFRENFTWLASILAYVVVVLTAMQVGLATKTLEESPSFQTASYGFTVFSIVSSLAAVAIVVAVFFVLFIYNWVKTKKYEKKRLLEIERLGENAATC